MSGMDVGVDVRWRIGSRVGRYRERVGSRKREAVDTTRNLAAAEGYFSAVTDVDIDRTTTPATVTLKVTEGPFQISRPLACCPARSDRASKAAHAGRARWAVSRSKVVFFIG